MGAGSRKRLERRLLPLLDLLPRPVSVLADVACDHGMLAQAALLTGKAAKVIGTDLNEKPLQAAVENIVRLRQKGRLDMPVPSMTGFTTPSVDEAQQTGDGAIEFRVGDGVRALSVGELDNGALVVAGVGTLLMCQREGGILAGTVASGAEFLLLQPSSYDCRHMRELRLVLASSGWRIQAETVTQEGSHFRVSLCAVKRGDVEAVDPLRSFPEHGAQQWTPLESGDGVETSLLFGSLLEAVTLTLTQTLNPIIDLSQTPSRTTANYLAGELAAFQERQQDRHKGGRGPDPQEATWSALTQEAFAMVQAHLQILHKAPTVAAEVATKVEAAHIVSRPGKKDGLSEVEIDQLVRERAAYRRDYAWAKADAIFDRLTQEGVHIQDIPFNQGGGATWQFRHTFSENQDKPNPIAKLIASLQDHPPSSNEYAERLARVTKLLEQNEATTFAKDREVVGRSHADMAFGLAVAGVVHQDIYALLVEGATRELKRCGGKASFPALDVLRMAERFAAAGVVDQEFYRLAADVVEAKAAGAGAEEGEEGSQALQDALPALRSGSYHLLNSERALVLLLKHSSKQRKSGLQSTDSMIEEEEERREGEAKSGQEATGSSQQEDLRHLRPGNLFADPSLPLVVDVGSGFGTTLLGMCRAEARQPDPKTHKTHNYLGIDMSQAAVRYARSVSRRWWPDGCERGEGPQFLLTDAESGLAWLTAHYAGPVVWVLCQFPSPYKVCRSSLEALRQLCSPGRPRSGLLEQPQLLETGASPGNRQLPGLEDFMFRPSLVRAIESLVTSCSSRKVAARLLLQSNNEDVCLLMRHMVEAGSCCWALSLDDTPSFPGAASDGWVADVDAISQPADVREGGRLEKCLRLAQANNWEMPRAVGVGFLTHSPLPVQTETEAYCHLVGKSVHRVCFTRAPPCAPYGL